MLRSVVMILSGNAAASLLLLLRNLLVARLLPVADYGIAATFAMIMAVVEMASAFGLQQQIIQSKDGDDPRFQAALQGFQLMRGVISGAVLFAIAAPVARFMGIPEVTGAYQILALAPVVKALAHLDIHRLNRGLRYGPLLLAGALPPLLSLLATWPLALWLGDWRVMLWAVLLQVAVGTLASHLLAERPWRIAYDPAIYRGSLKFGWPLLINGVLLFLVFQGDKLIVGRELGMSDLAIFSMGMTLMLTPGLVFSRSLQSFFLPRLSAAKGAQFNGLALAASELSLLFGTALVVASALLGGLFVDLVLGEKYAPLTPLLVWLAVVQSLRGMKSGTAVAALAQAQTGNAMLANLLRVAVLPLAWVLLAGGGDLRGLLVLALLGELAGVVLALWLQSRRQGVPIAPLMPLALCTALAHLLTLFWNDFDQAWPLLLAAFAAAALSVVFARASRRVLSRSH